MKIKLSGCPRLRPESSRHGWSWAGLEGARSGEMQYVRDAFPQSPSEDDDETRQ